MRGNRRIRMAVVDNVVVVATLLVLVAATGGYLTYTTYEEPAMTTETRERASWESSLTFSHRARVVDGTAAFPEGAVLRDRSVYFARVAPRLNGTATYTYSVSDSGSLTTNTTIALVFRSIASDDGDNATVYWRTERLLERSTAGPLSPGESANVPFSVNVTAAAAQARRIDEQLGGSPGELRIEIVARTRVTGERNGREVAETRIHRLPISVSDGVYRVDDPGAATASDTQTERVTVPAEYGPTRRLGGPLLLVVGLVGLAGLGYGRYTGGLSVTDEQRQWHAYERSRAEFDEWITTGRVPKRAEGPPVVTVDSLEGLVDVAIDTDNRVIEDDIRDACLVLGDNQWFRYERPPEPRADSEALEVVEYTGEGAQSADDGSGPDTEADEHDHDAPNEE